MKQLINSTWPSSYVARPVMLDTADRGLWVRVNGGGAGTNRENSTAELGLIAALTVTIPANAPRLYDIWRLRFVVRQYNNSGTAHAMTVRVKQEGSVELANSTSDSLASGAFQNRYGIFDCYFNFNAIGASVTVMSELTARWYASHIASTAMANPTVNHARVTEIGGFNTTIANNFEITGQLLTVPAHVDSEMQLMNWSLFRAGLANQVA